MLVMDYRGLINIPVLGACWRRKHQMCFWWVQFILLACGGAPYSCLLWKSKCPNVWTDYYQDTSNEEKRVKNNKVRAKLEVQSCCQMLSVRLSFEPVSIQIFLSFSLENAAICRKGFFPLVWKKPQQLSFDGGIA